MLENVFKEGSGVTPAGSPPPSPRRPSLAVLLLPPLLLLGLLGLIVYLFGWLSFDRRDAMGLMEEVRGAQGERRALAAYELSRLESFDLDAVSKPRFLAVAEGLLAGGQETDARVKRSMALTLGRLKERSSVAALRAAAEDPDPETQIYALWSLGAIGDPAASDSLISHLQSDDPAVRKTAAFALGQLGDRSAVAPLRVALQDTSPDVTWNAAVALARLGDETGLPILLPIIEGRLTAAEGESRSARLPPAQLENLRITAIRAARALAAEAARSALRRAVSSDAPARIRAEARLALKGQSPPPFYPSIDVASPR